MIEKPLDRFVDPTNVDRTAFYQFRDGLISYFEATKRFREHLVSGIEDARNNGTHLV